MNPAPPASTTPASRSTGSRSGVEASATRPAAACGRSTVTTCRRHLPPDMGPSADSRTTVRIVPSIGLSTAWYAAADAAFNASATVVPVPSAASLQRRLPDHAGSG